MAKEKKVKKEEICKNCNGIGVIEERSCPKCGGSGLEK